MTRIILDTDGLVSDEARKKLDQSIGESDYSLESGDKINNDDDRLRKVEVLLFGNASNWLSKEKFAKMPNLRLIQTISAGVDYIKFDEIPENVLVCGNVGAFSEPIAEHVFAMILAFAKDLFAHQRELSNERFNQHVNHLFLKGKNITILGTGGIGQAAARLANCFQMNAFGVNSTGRNLEGFQRVTTLSGVGELLHISDVVVITLPLTLKTRGLIDSARLNEMKEDAILVNIARGAIIVERDLYEHLVRHPKFRAALDMWWGRRPRSTEEKLPWTIPSSNFPISSALLTFQETYPSHFALRRCLRLKT